MNRMLTDRPSADVAYMVDAFDGKEPPATSQPLASHFTHELKAELLRRGLTDFSRWQWAVTWSPWALLVLALTLWKVADNMPGTVLACLFGR